MPRAGRCFTAWRFTCSSAALGFVLLTATAEARAAKYVLKDGRILEGRMTKLTSLAETPQNAPEPGAPVPRLIIMVDDDLRRTCVPKARIQEVNEADVGTGVERFAVKQRVARSGGRGAQWGALVGFGAW